MKDSIKLSPGDIINKKVESRDPFDILFEVKAVDNDSVICHLTCVLPYRVIYQHNNIDIYAVDPSGGPFMAVDAYELQPGLVLQSIKFIEDNKTECRFVKF